MSDKHTGPYVPEAMYKCSCGDPADPSQMYWMDLSKEWLCNHCLVDAGESVYRSTLTLADYLKSLEPRWVPVTERLPDKGDRNFDGSWFGWVIIDGQKCNGSWFFEHGRITHWLDFTPPELPGEEVGE